MLENSPPPSDAQVSKAHEMNKHVAHMLHMVKTWDKSDTIPTRVDQLPEKVRAEMTGWARAIFKDSCSLVTVAESYRIILANGENRDDVVVHDFLLGERRGTMYETEGQIVLVAPTISKEATDRDELHATIHGLSETCLAASLTWKVRPSSDIEGPVALSSSPYQTIWNGPAWHSRVDAGTFDNRLFMLLYKRLGQVFGLGGGEWFDPEFRLRVAESARPRRE